MISQITEKQMNTPFDFSDDELVYYYIIGTSKLHPVLHDDLMTEGRNIEYDVAPKYRSKEMGTLILKWTI